MHEPVDLLLVDLILPDGMNGRDLALEVQKRKPGVRVLFMSGHANHAIMHHGRLDQGIHFLEKPFRKNELSQKVREALDAISS